MNTKMMGCAVCGIMITAAGWAHAQGYGLQVVDPVEMREAGPVDLTVGATVGDESQFYGARSTYRLQKGLRVSVDLGAAHPPEGQIALAAQGSLLASLDVASPVPLAIRAAVYGMNGDRMNVLGGNAMLLTGSELIFEGLYFYTGLGIDFRTISERSDPVLQDGRMVEQDDVSDDTASAIWALGALMPITENVHVYTELTLTDKPFIGCGLWFHW